MNRAFLWAFAILSIEASAEKLTYHAPYPVFELERTNQSLVLRSQNQELKLNISNCNQVFAQELWLTALKEFERYPITRGAVKARFAELDGKRRLVLPAMGYDRLAKIPETFMGLYALNRQKCKN